MKAIIQGHKAVSLLTGKEAGERGHLEMKRCFYTVAIGFSLILGALGALSVGSETAEADNTRMTAADLFAPAENFVVHTSTTERRQQLHCLALNIYWEARSEPITGQLAVAAVTLNRVQDPRFPSNVCDVVRQGGEIRRHRCQFSWWCDGKKDDPKDAESWRRANTLARLSSAGIVDDPTQGALWYHADYVTPYWAAKKERVAQIGRHIFYVLPTDKDVQVSENTNSNVVMR